VKALVTGASGVLGAALLRRLGDGATGVSRSGREGFLRADLADPDQVASLFSAGHFDAVLHAAAYSDVDGCERDPEEAWACNALSAKHLADACSRAGTPLVYVSTDYVFDGAKRAPYEETDRTGPVNVYGMTKLAGEHYAAACRAPSATVRTSWLFGAGNPKNFVNVLRERLRTESAVAVLDDQEDAPTYAADLAEAVERIARRLAERAGRSGGPAHEIYQFRNAGSTTRLGMARRMKEVLGSPAAIGRLDPGALAGRLAVRPAYGVLSTRRYEEVFGEKVRPWQDALAEYLTDRGNS